MVYALLALVAAVLAGTFVWVFLRSQQAVVSERLRAAEAENLRLQAAHAGQLAQLAELEGARARVEQELASVRAGSTERLAAEQQRFAEQEKRAAQYLADIEKMRATLQTEFQAVAARLLDEKSAKFTEQNKAQLDGLLSPLKQQLVDFRSRIDVIYKTEGDDRTALKAQIEQLRQLNSTITTEAHALTQALKGQAQVRGAWGELVLDRLLEGCGLRRGEDYVTQESLPDADGRRGRPDVILRLPNNHHLVIDSKVSLVDYERAANETDPALQVAAKRAHVAAVKKRVQELTDKKYEDAGALFSPEYVFMFVPIEPALAMALTGEPELYDWAFDRRVILVTSSGLLAALRTVSTLWTQDRQTKNVQEIARRGGLLYDKFAGLVSDLDDIGQHLARAQSSHQQAFGKLKTGAGNLLSQVEDLKKLGAKAKKSLPAPEAVEE